MSRPMSVDTTTEPLLDLRGVSKVYASGSLQVTALYEVDLQVAPGEFVAVMGPSGSGKSTLMNILGCLDVPSAGRYRLAGDEVDELDESALAEIRNRRVGFVFQQFNLLANLPAWRNVELPLSYTPGIGRTERRRRAVAALDQVGLADRIDHRPGELSGGQQQRVSIARAMVTDPPLLLADEPTGNLDSAATEEILALLTDLNHQGRTIIVITHEPDVAARAHRVLVMRDGRLDGEVA